MNHDSFGGTIRGILEQSLDSETMPVAKLRASREQALAAFARAQAATEPVPLTALAGVGRLPQPPQAGLRTLLVRVVLPAAILLAAVLGWQQWQHSLRTDPDIEGLGRIDAELLKSDLPVDALIDPDFKAYLHKVATSRDAAAETASDGTPSPTTEAGSNGASGRSER
jgi:hypothetical protein